MLTTRKETIILSLAKKGKHSACILQEVLPFWERILKLEAPPMEQLWKTEPYAKS
jgi:hypothetical protein